MANAWGVKPATNWAEEVDAAEAQNGGPLSEAFPSLGEAIKAPKDAKPVKKKPVKLGLGAFIGSSRTQPSEAELRLQLPTSSRGKVEGEEGDSGALGGAFKDYGGERRGEQPSLADGPSALGRASAERACMDLRT